MLGTKNYAVPNTLNLTSVAARGCRVQSVGELKRVRSSAVEAGLSFFVLGQGSNIIPHPHVNKFVCQLSLRGIEIVRETSDEVFVRVAAGESWHEFVMSAVRNKWYGLENLALIPGSVGAAPVQNIGAYGVEVASTIQHVEVLSLNSEVQNISVEACEFAYRDSIFKRNRSQIILAVQFRLQKKAKVVVEYAQLKQQLKGLSSVEPTPQQIAVAVMQIRQAKLPDPSRDANVGSFFKNPIVSYKAAAQIMSKHQDLVQYPQHNGVKLSAAQLIDRAGWKNKGTNAVECWPTQPLVIVNNSATQAAEIIAFADAIKADIYKRYEVELELEPYELF